MTTEPDSRGALIGQILDDMAVLVAGIRRNFPTAVDAIDITIRQCRAMMFLADAPATMSKLAGAIGASLPSTTGLVDRLVQRGIVSRHEDPHDRRLVVCELTDQGRAVIATLQEEDRTIFATLFAGLMAEDLETVHAATRILTREVRRIAAEGAPAVAVPTN